MRTSTPPAARLAGLVGLAAFGAWQWGLLVSPGAAGRIMLALAGAAGAAGLLLVGAGRGRVVRAGLAVVAVLGSAALVLLAAGVPAQLLAPGNWNDLLDGIGQGVQSLPEIAVPYAGVDPWPRLVILAGGGLLVAFAVLTAFGAFGRTRRSARAARALPLAALLLLFVVPSVARELPDPFLRGAMFAVLVAAFLWLERVTPASAPRAAALVAGAVGLGLLAAPLLDRQTPILNVNDLAASIAPARGSTFEWDHRYGPLNWPRDGREVLRIKASHAAYWKAENLDGFDGLRWLHVRSAAPEEAPAAFYSHPDWTQDVRVTVRALHSDQFIGAGTTLQIADARAAPVAAGSPGTYDADSPLRSGDSYLARVYTPRPTAPELARAGVPGPRGGDRSGILGSPLYPYMTVALPASIGPGTYAAQPEIDAPGEGGVVFPAFGRGGAPSTILRGVLLGDGAAAVRASPYAGAYALSRRLAAGAHTPYEYVRAVEAYLSKGFSYSESPPQRAVPLASFLASDRTGYCQQFSGAMALLLRMGGVPARVATGFAPGAYNRSRGEYVIRDNDAHSWVEAYFEPYGWVPFDPTPPAAPAASQASYGTTPSAGSPDPRDTGAGRHPARKGATAFATGGDAGPGALPILAVAGLVAAVLGALALAVPRRRRRAGWPRDPYVAELERALRRTGRPAPPGTTLQALERRLASLPAAAAYLRALRAYRFAAGAPTPTPAQRRGLRRALSRGLGPRGRVRALWALPPRLR